MFSWIEGQSIGEEWCHVRNGMADPPRNTGQASKKRTPPMIITRDQRDIIVASAQQQRGVQEHAVRLKQTCLWAACKAGEWAEKQCIDTQVAMHRRCRPWP